MADQCRDAKSTVPQGEGHRQGKILESVLRQMLEFNMGRGDLVIAVGGGVVGRSGGFLPLPLCAASTSSHCPTTTLSMSIPPSAARPLWICRGDEEHRRFLLAAQAGHRPAPSPPARRQYINGLAEVGEGQSAGDQDIAIFEGRHRRADRRIIYPQPPFKSIVEQDETEHGVRKALNFGHTIGTASRPSRRQGRRTTQALPRQMRRLWGSCR